MLEKVARSLVLKFATSEIISENNFKGGGKHPPPPPPVRLGLNLGRKMVFTIHFQNFGAKMIPSGRVQGSRRYPVLEF